MIRSLLVLVMIGVAAPAWPCYVGPLLSAERLVDAAEVIARARAEGLSSTPGRASGLSASPTQVRFAILELLKGRLPSITVEFNGSLTDRDDRNDVPVPYNFVRPGGRQGNCVALEYRVGAEYLLLLRRAAPAYVGGVVGLTAEQNELTPYRAPLSPTNEQLFGGASDPWFVWVSNQLRRR
jgi:hypothetical protein